MSCRRLIKKCFRSARNQKGVALFIVLGAMATLSIFVTEITYVSQINQKLAYDRLDQIKALALAKSGFRIALLRIRAYNELRKTISETAKNVDANIVNAMVPKGAMEKIWSEPITVPFTGNIDGLPTSIKDALTKFRKDSGMEGKLYIAIQAQSSKININHTLPAFAAIAAGSPSPSPSPRSGGGATPGASPSPSPSASPIQYNPEDARQGLLTQIKKTFQDKFDADQKFRDQYRNLRLEDLADDIFGWCDLTYQSTRAQNSTIPLKKAPFYDISELHYLPSVDDEIYQLLAPQFSANATSTINVNTITDAILTALFPDMTEEERKKFFDFRSGVDADSGQTENPTKKDNSFKNSDDFYKYLQEKTAAYNTPQRIQGLKDALAQRGIVLITDEMNFIVRIEATVRQTKRTLEAMVSILPVKKPPPTPGTPGVPAGSGNPEEDPNAIGTSLNERPTERSDLKVTQLRFL